MPNKIILITGGTGKVGSQLVKQFASLGYKVIVSGRTMSKLKALADEINSNNNHCVFPIQVDHEKEDAANKIISFLNSHDFMPDVLINNVRNISNLRIGESGITDRQAWLGEFTVGVVNSYELSMALVLHEHTRLQAIINITSMYGIVAPNLALYEDHQKQSPIQYGVVKAALIHLTKELAVRLAEFKVRVNSIAYGGIEGRVDEEFKKRYAKLCPQGCMLQEEDVVGAAEFLATDKSMGVTGHNLVVDGGWTIW